MGKVDLVGVIGRTTLAVAELKHTDQHTTSRGDTPLRALLEVLGYCAIVEANLDDIGKEMAAAEPKLRPERVEILVIGSAWYWEKWEKCAPAGAWQASLSACCGDLMSTLGIPIRFLSLHDPAFTMGGPGRKPRLTGKPALRAVVGLPS